MKLIDFLNRTRISRKEMAEDLFLSRMYFNLIVVGTHKPSKKVIKMIEIYTRGLVRACDFEDEAADDELAFFKPLKFHLPENWDEGYKKPCNE